MDGGSVRMYGRSNSTCFPRLPPEVESISADVNAAVITFGRYMNPETVSGFKLISADGGEVVYRLICDKS